MIKDKVKFVPPKRSLLFPISQSRIDRYLTEIHNFRYANKVMVPETVVLRSIVVTMPCVLLLVFAQLLAVSFLWPRMCFILSGVGRRGTTVNRRMLTGLLLTKAVYLSFFFVFPASAAGIVCLQALLGLLIMPFAARFVRATCFAPAYHRPEPFRSDWIPG